MAINDWSTNPANNTLVGGINWTEGQLPSTVNGSARQMMADVAAFRDYLYGGTSPFAFTTGATFTGAIKRDANFYLELVTGKPIVNFDGNDYFEFDRVANALTLYLGSQQRMVVRESGNLDFFASAPMRFNNTTVWCAGNDGAGSGLDADLLDGQQGDYYTNIPARLGYAPVSKAGDTLSGSLSIAFAGSPTLTLNSAGVATGKLSMQNDGNLVLYRNGGSGDVAVFGVSSQAGPFAVQMPITRQGNQVWDAGNDGAGSGLDADLLDGLQGSAYARVISSDYKANGGSRVWQDGMKEAWGNVSVPANSSVTVTFPFTYSAWVNPVLGTGVVVNSGSNQNVGISNLTTADMTLYNAEDAAIPVYWQTKGV